MEKCGLNQSKKPAIRKTEQGFTLVALHYLFTFAMTKTEPIENRR